MDKRKRKRRHRRDRQPPGSAYSGGPQRGCVAKHDQHRDREGYTRQWQGYKASNRLTHAHAAGIHGDPVGSASVADCRDADGKRRVGNKSHQCELSGRLNLNEACAARIAVMNAPIMLTTNTGCCNRMEISGHNQRELSRFIKTR